MNRNWLRAPLGSLRKNIALFLGFLLFFASQASSHAQVEIERLSDTGFLDVDQTHPYFVPITYLAQQGVIQGYDDQTFKSEREVKKAEALKIIIQGSQIPTDVAFAPLFPDVLEADWFWPHALKAHALGIVHGNDEDGSFTGYEQVNLAEFLKMLLLANQIDLSGVEQAETTLPNIAPDAWFARYLNYGVQTGMVPLNEEGSVNPSQLLTRGEVVNLMYLLILIMNGADTDFLLQQMQHHVAQIEVYIADNHLDYAKVASALADDLGQQIFKNDADDSAMVAMAKVARAYDFLVDAYILGAQGDLEGAALQANAVIQKATEIWQADPAQQPIAAHLKALARQLLSDVGGIEVVQE